VSTREEPGSETLVVLLHSLRRFVVRPGARTANHRDEVALLRGLAAAIDKYEERPHGEFRLT